MKRLNSRRRRSLFTSVVLSSLACTIILDLGAVTKAAAHGSVEQPPSRTYTCRFFDLDDPMCIQAWAADPQSLYDWMEVNIGDAAGRHQELIPDGQLCSAGREKYAAFDEPGDWPTRALEPDSEGLYSVDFFATAPHAAEYFRFYLSREGFDPIVDRLGWDDLELVHDSGPVAYTDLVAQPHYPFRLALPGREGRYVLYLVWQRSDSPEAFYGCSDVVVGTDSGSAGPSAPVVPPETSPESTHDPVSPAPGLQGVEVAVDLADDWGAGACGEGVVTNHSSGPAAWEVHVELAGTVTTHWDSVMSLSTHPHGEGSAIGQNWRVVGAAWNAILQPGASTTFGFCIDRTTSPDVGDGGEPIDTPDLPVEPPGAPTDPAPAEDPEAPVVVDDETAAPESDPVSIEPGSGAILAAYFPEWGIYARNYRIADVPAAELTHLIYAFADLDSNGDVTLFDSYAAVEKQFQASESVSGVADTAGSPGEVRGNFRQIALLKERHPHLRVSIAIGGWTLSRHFSSVLATAAGREHASDSVIEFLERYDMFDGVDFDWEYPGGGGLAANGSSAEDGRNYALFLGLVRQKLDGLSNTTGKSYQISVASPAGYDKIGNFNLAGLEGVVDFFNVMTYDFHGTWENVTGHLAAFDADPAGYDISTTIGLYLEAGVSPEKIVLGSPLYTRAWAGVAAGDDGGYAEAATGAAPGSFWDQSGMYDYKDLLGRLRANGSSWELYWDDNAQAAYLYDGSQGIFSSFETPGSVALKSGWAQYMDLGGMMFWDLSSDATGDPESLVTAAFDAWVRGVSFDEIVSVSDLEFDQILGGNGRFDPIVLAEPAPADPGSTGSEAGEAPAGDPGVEEGGAESPLPPDADPGVEEGGAESPPPPVAEEPDALANVSVEVGGVRWWQGFTAELTVHNESGAQLDSWSFGFRSSHSISGAPWGIEIATTDLGNGFFEHRMTGTGWGSSIPAGGSVTVGFNGQQGTLIGNDGPLTAGQVFDGGLLAD